MTTVYFPAFSVLTSFPEAVVRVILYALFFPTVPISFVVPI
jgi:hypothetical protein